MKKEENVGTKLIELIYMIIGLVATFVWLDWKLALFIFIIATFIGIIINRIIKN